MEKGIITKNIEFKEYYDDDYNEIKHFVNWPVVYIIYNRGKQLAYVGETVDLKTRLMQHYQDPRKNELKDKNTRVMYIDYDYANKSTCLDLESFLICNMKKDSKFDLINGNDGLQKYEYYDKDNFKNFCEEVWEELYKEKMVNNTFTELKNKKIQYSPYMALNQEQNYVVKQIIKELVINDKETIVVNGGAGTGKTAVAVHLLKLLKDYANNQEGIVLENMVDEKIDDIKSIIDYFSKKNMKIGIVFPMEVIHGVASTSIKKMYPRGTVDFIFRPVEAVEYYLKNNKEKFDILIVDEAQRLARENTVAEKYGDERKQVLKSVGLFNKDQLDWVYKISKKQIIFYDSKQRIRKDDIELDIFKEKIKSRNYKELELTVQERCLYGGEDYIKCIQKLFSSNTKFNDKTINELKELINKTNNKKTNKKYEFVMYNDVTKMTDRIKELFKDNKGMCYTFTGNCWKTKDGKADVRKNIYNKYKDKLSNEEYYNKYLNEIIDTDAQNIEIGNFKTILNDCSNWLNNELHCKNEVGIVHIIAGLDADYIGVIIGDDLGFKNEKLEPITTKNIDKGKNYATEEERKEFILDSYYILCSRARKGTYIYICNEELRKEFSKFMKIADK